MVCSVDATFTTPRTTTYAITMIISEYIFKGCKGVYLELYVSDWIRASEKKVRHVSFGLFYFSMVRAVFSLSLYCSLSCPWVFCSHKILLLMLLLQTLLKTQKPLEDVWPPERHVMLAV